MPPLQDGTWSFYLQRLGFESSRWCYATCHRSSDGTQRFERCWLGFNSSRWLETSPVRGGRRPSSRSGEVRFLSVARFVTVRFDSSSVLRTFATGSIPLRCFALSPLVRGGQATVNRSGEVRFLLVAPTSRVRPSLAGPPGDMRGGEPTRFDPSSDATPRTHSLGRGSIPLGSDDARRENFSGCSSAARACSSLLRGHWCKSSHPDEHNWM